MSSSVESSESETVAPLSERGNSSSLPRVLRNSLQLLGGSGIAALIALVVTVYSARLLGASDFGLLAIIAASSTFLNRFFGVQCGSAVLRFGAALQAVGREHELRLLIHSCWVLEASAGIVVAIFALLVILMVPFAHAAMSDIWMLVLGYAAVVATNWSNTASGILRLMNKFGPLSLQPVVANATKLAGLAIAYVVDGDLLAVGLAWIVGDVIGNLFLTVSALAASMRNRDQRIEKRNLRVVVSRDTRRFILVASAHASIKTGLREADVLLVGAILGREGAGGYRIAKQVGSSLMKLVDPLMQSSFPEMARAADRSANAEVRFLVTRIAGLATIVTLPIAVAFWCFGGPIVTRLLGEQFSFANQAMSIYLLGSVVAASGIALQPAALSIGLQAASLRILAASVVIYLGLLWYLTARFGLAGSAWSFVTFYAIWSFEMWRAVIARTTTGRLS